jgi:antitoxin component YwqK of YwqJK toxin-antitoxin module
MKKMILAGVVLLGTFAAAADPTLVCPAGSKQVGGAKSALEAVVCVRSDKDGGRIFHGPYIAFWPNGQRQAEGQYENGWRSGTFTFFDQAGVKTGITEFKHGEYDGMRVEFHANGMKKLEESYLNGVKQGESKLFDPLGKPVQAATANKR